MIREGFHPALDPHLDADVIAELISLYLFGSMRERDKSVTQRFSKPITLTLEL